MQFLSLQEKIFARCYLQLVDNKSARVFTIGLKFATSSFALGDHKENASKHLACVSFDSTARAGVRSGYTLDEFALANFRAA